MATPFDPCRVGFHPTAPIVQSLRLCSMTDDGVEPHPTGDPGEPKNTANPSAPPRTRASRGWSNNLYAPRVVFLVPHHMLLVPPLPHSWVALPHLARRPRRVGFHPTMSLWQPVRRRISGVEPHPTGEPGLDGTHRTGKQLSPLGSVHTHGDDRAARPTPRSRTAIRPASGAPPHGARRLRGLKDRPRAGPDRP